MPDNTIGYAFAPTFNNAQQARRNAQASAPAGTIQTLNFRLPNVTNAPSPLITDQRMGSTFGGAVLQSVLRTVLGPDAAAQFTPSGGGGSVAGGSVGDDQGSAILAQLVGMARVPVPSQNRPSSPAPQFPTVNGSAPDYATAWMNRNPIFGSKYGDMDPLNQYLWSGSRGNGTYTDLRSAPPDLSTPNPRLYVGNDYNLGGNIV